MQAKICDRCGEAYTENKIKATRGNLHGGYIGTIKLCDYNYKVDSSYDLCDFCVLDLFNFLEGKLVYGISKETCADDAKTDSDR